MKRKKPSFDESYYGYRSFTHLLEDADNSAMVDIERNPQERHLRGHPVRRRGEAAYPPRRAAAAASAIVMRTEIA